jgi:hypothetical protein
MISKVVKLHGKMYRAERLLSFFIIFVGNIFHPDKCLRSYR